MRLGNLLHFVAFFKEVLYRGVSILGPDHWGLLSIYNLFHYLISVGFHWWCNFRGSFIIRIDIVHVKVEARSVLTSTASRILNRDSCLPDLLNTTERVGAWGQHCFTLKGGIHFSLILLVFMPAQIWTIIVCSMMLLLIAFLILHDNYRVWNGNLFPSDVRIDPSLDRDTGAQSSRVRWRWHQPRCRVLHLLNLLQGHDRGVLLTALPRVEKGTGALPFTGCLTPYELLFEIQVSDGLWDAFTLR